MRLASLFFSLVMADPCTDLCQRDGPSVCTNGSWTKPNGFCQNYLYRGDPANGDYCYHSSATAALCPGDGTGVRAVEVPLLLAPLVPEPPIDPILVRPYWTNAEGVNIRFRFRENDVKLNLQHPPMHQADYLLSVHQDLDAYILEAIAWKATEPDYLLRGLMDLSGVARFEIDQTITVESPSERVVQCMQQQFLVGTFESSVDFPNQSLDWKQRLCSLMKFVRIELENRYNSH
jgi:hypothetical protein